LETGLFLFSAPIDAGKESGTRGLGNGAQHDGRGKQVGLGEKPVNCHVHMGYCEKERKASVSERLAC
jgi:hypothetical protein